MQAVEQKVQTNHKEGEEKKAGLGGDEEVGSCGEGSSHRGAQSSKKAC